MTVKQLVEILKDLPQDAEVLIWDFGAGGTVPVEQVDPFTEVGDSGRRQYVVLEPEDQS